VFKKIRVRLRIRLAPLKVCNCSGTKAQRGKGTKHEKTMSLFNEVPRAGRQYVFLSALCLCAFATLCLSYENKRHSFL